MLKLSKI